MAWPMKNFFTTVLAVFTAFVASILLLIGLLVIASISGEDPTPKVEENTLLRIPLSGTLEDRAVEDPLAGLDAALLGMDVPKALGMNELMAALEHAAQDDRVQGILLEQGAFAAGYGMLEELADYLKEFKATSGKPIYSYGEYYTQKGAALSAIADSTILHPGGIFELRGIGTSSTYYKDFFDKFGIEPLVVRGTGNKFKSAVEPYIASEMSDENRLQLTNLITQFWDFIGDSFEAKGIDRATLDQAATDFIGMDADACLEAGLVDALGYKEDIMNHFEDRYSLLNYADYAAQIPPVKATDRIAIIYANGSIGNGKGDESTIGTENIVKALRKADKNKRVKAIVLRVNSPGGSALTSDIIHHTIADIEKPLIVSQANYAASGGYYISCNADAIFTNSTTITGSIGIFMSLFTAEELMTQTLGLNVEEVQTHPMANFPNLAKHPDEAQYAILQRMIDRGYADFTGKVAEGRSMDMDYLLPLCGGRVWTGDDAIDNGLADIEGNLSDAIAYAAKEAGIESYKLYELPKVEDGLEKYLKSLGAAKAESLPFLDHPAVQELEFLATNPGLQARLNPIFLEL
jgi:protease-4